MKMKRVLFYVGGFVAGVVITAVVMLWPGASTGSAGGVSTGSADGASTGSADRASTGSAGGATATVTAVAPDGGDLILQEGGAARLDLPETAPEDVEENPLLTVTLLLQDAVTGAPVVGDVFLYQKLPHESLDVLAALPVIPCEGAAVCVLEELPPLADGAVWLIQVRVVGYQDWALELNHNAKSSRSLELPVRLIRKEVVYLVRRAARWRSGGSLRQAQDKWGMVGLAN